MKKISVIVVETEAIYTQQCLKAIYTQHGCNTEVIVVFGGSYEALVNAIERVSGDTLLLLRSTDFPGPMCLQQLVKQTDTGICRCRTVLCSQGSCTEGGDGWSPYGVLWPREQFAFIRSAIKRGQTVWEFILSAMLRGMNIPTIEDAYLYTEYAHVAKSPISALIALKKDDGAVIDASVPELVELCGLENRGDEDCLLSISVLESELPLSLCEISVLESRYIKPIFTKLTCAETSCEGTYDAFRRHLTGLVGRELDLPFIFNCTGTSLEMIRSMDFDAFSEQLFSKPKDLAEQARAHQDAVLSVEETCHEELFGLALVNFVQECVMNRKLGMRTLLQCMCIWLKTKFQRG